MNTRENLIYLLTKELELMDYTVCSAEELPTVAGRCGSPMAVVGEPKMVSSAVAGATTAAYDVGVKMLIQRRCRADKSAPILAIIEDDVLAVAERVAEAERVVNVAVRELAPIAGGLTHTGDVAMSVGLRVEMFKSV